MKKWFNGNISNKLIAILIASVFVVVTLACFTVATNHGHTLDVGAACEIVINLADNTVIQTGLALLLIAAAAGVCHRSFLTFSLSDAIKQLRVLHSPPSHSLVSPQEHCYLKKLFSSGIIHSKLHSLTA